MFELPPPRRADKWQVMKGLLSHQSPNHFYITIYHLGVTQHVRTILEWSQSPSPCLSESCSSNVATLRIGTSERPEAWKKGKLKRLSQKKNINKLQVIQRAPVVVVVVVVLVIVLVLLGQLESLCLKTAQFLTRKWSFWIITGRPRSC